MATEVLDPDEFLLELRRDMEKLSYYGLIISPFLNRTAVEKFYTPREVDRALREGKKIVVVTRPALTPEVEDQEENGLCIKIPRDHGTKLIKEEKFHETVTIDDSILYVGSINPLQIITVKYIPADYMLRFVSEALVDEITERFIPEYQDWLK